MAASAPIQFTVDQEQLKTIDNATAKVLEHKPYIQRTARIESSSSLASASSIDDVTSRMSASVLSDASDATTAASASAADNEKSEIDIYNEKVLACSIANPEACEMCSG